MEITLENINKFGFLFHIYDHKKILKNTDEETFISLENYINSLITIPGEKLYGDIDIIYPDTGIDLHFHVIPGSFQVVVWAPDCDFKGRQYVYGNPKCLQYVKPFRGLMCFMKPNDSNFIHGVTKLLSEKPVKSYGFTSSTCQLPERNDIYISLDQT